MAIDKWKERVVGGAMLATATLIIWALFTATGCAALQTAQGAAAVEAAATSATTLAALTVPPPFNFLVAGAIATIAGLFIPQEAE